MTIPLPVEAFSLELDDKEFRLLSALCHLSSRVGTVEATMEELAILTNRGPENVRRALRGLEKHGLVVTVRTKRNLGKLYKNRYTLPHCTVEELVPEDTLVHSTVGSTGGQVVPVSINGSNSSNDRTSRVDTTYLSVEGSAPHLEKKEIPVVNRWQDDDDDLAGVGLLEGEVPASKAKRVVSDKRKPATRGKRPVAEWTSYDMATEFSYRLGRKFPMIPGLVNVKNLAGALAKNRKAYGITAEFEMEVMNLFFGDERRWRSAEEAPHLIHGKYLRMFTTHFDEVMNNLGLAQTNGVVAEVAQQEYIYSSDGRKFDDSLLGRKALARHEATLEGN